MTTEAESAARARVRAFLAARDSYARSLPLSIVAQSTTDIVASQASESGINKVELSGSIVAGVETLAPGTYSDTLVRLLASDLALLVADDDERVVLPNGAFDAIAATLDEPAGAVPELVDLFKRARVTPVADES